ncbi:hypothetical protein [Idiomarina sp. ST10R2A5]|uniref:hypothetical protein n=1 Tax=Idiomarina sp. ST10R2A5 TaxID=3418368 RepID=UPI003EC6C5E3
MNKIDFTHLYDEISRFPKLPGSIDELSMKAFESVYGSEEAANAKEIIYVFLSHKPIPRLIGKSNILYIGQTKSSFKTRRLKDAKLHVSSKANSLKYAAIIKNYGPITVRVCDYRKYGNTHKEAEGQLLWWYFQNHCEYPPINYTQTKIRKDVVEA